MPQNTQKAYMMHSKTDTYKKNIRKAEQNITKILTNPELRPVIEYSGGKDSIVLTDLIMKQDNNIPVWNYHPGYAQSTQTLFRSTKIQKEIEYTLTTLNHTPLTIHTSNIPPLNKNGLCTDQEYRIKDYFDCLFEYMDNEQLNLELLGIRGQESITRRERVKQPLVHIEYDRVVSFPISHLTTDDIWAYIISNDIYYCSHYDKYASTYGYEKCRFTSHYNENDLATGGSVYFDKIMEM